MPAEEKTPFVEAYARLNYIGESEDARHCIASAIVQLPDDVREFALEGGFLTVGDPAAGFYLRRENLRYLADGVPWLIVLSDAIDYEELPGLAAHELAHLWLGHPTGTTDLTAFAECEEAAAGLVREWGFGGMGAHPSSEHLTGPLNDA
jgi:hypothetical protein